MTDQETLVEKSNRALQPKPDETAESWIQRQAQADASIDVLLLNEVVRRLRLPITPAQATELLIEFQQHKDVLLQTRSREIKEFNFNSIGGIIERLPEPPSQVTTWPVLRDAWISTRGGCRDVTGRGLSQHSIDRANKHWSEIQSISKVVNPSDLTTEMIRDWIKWMQSRLQATTVLSNLKIIKAVLGTGVSEGLLETNVAEKLRVSTESVEGYLPFTDEEIIKILKATVKTDLDYLKWLPRLALYSGARIEELSQLRREDIREINGVMCLDFVHQPDHKLPTILKGKIGSERQVPIHPWLKSEGFIDYYSDKTGRIFKGSGNLKKTVGPSATRQFKLLTERLNIWIERKKVFHSFRGTFKDNCRRAGIPPDVHHAWTGHAPGNVGDKSYGLTLRKMPEVTVKHMLKLPDPF